MKRSILSLILASLLLIPAAEAASPVAGPAASPVAGLAASPVIDPVAGPAASPVTGPATTPVLSPAAPDSLRTESSSSAVPAPSGVSTLSAAAMPVSVSPTADVPTTPTARASAISATAPAAPAASSASAPASAVKEPTFTVQLHGTVRAKFEYQPDLGKSRFEVRNARFSLSGQVTPLVNYKAEIDLSDEGSIKMLDAYARLNLLQRRLRFTIGQMRVPFTIDAHRSPHEQYFANRSFIAKQAGNVRDVGATLAWSFGRRVPVTLEGGALQRLGADQSEGLLDAVVQLFGQGALPLCRAGEPFAEHPEDPPGSGRHPHVRHRRLLRE